MHSIERTFHPPRKFETDFRNKSGQQLFVEVTEPWARTEFTAVTLKEFTLLDLGSTIGLAPAVAFRSVREDAENPWLTN